MDGRRILWGAAVVVVAWLVVPASASANSNVTISTGPDTSPPPLNCQFTATGDDFNIFVGSLEACANTMATSVSTSSAGLNPGTITIQSSVAWSGHTLTLNANSTVTQDAGDTMTGDLAVATGSAPITLTEANNFGTVSLTNSGATNDASVTDTNGLSLGASSVGRNLTVNASGIVTQSGALTAGGELSVGAGSGNSVVLQNIANNFPKFAAPTAGVVQVTDSSALALGNSSVSALTLTTTGNLTQLSGEHVTVSGNTTLSIGGAHNATLDATANSFGGSVNLGSLHDATLVAGGPVALASSGGVIGGNLAVTAGGAITQSSGALTVTGTSSFDAGSASISMSTPANDFSGAVSLLASGTGTATVKDASGLTLGAVHVGGNLTVSASGDVTQSGAANVAVGGLTMIAPGPTHDVNLHVVANNDLNQLNVPSATNVSVLDSGGGIVLTGIGASNNVTVGAAGGAITQTAPVTAPGTMLVSTDSAAGDDVTLPNTDNDFGTFAASNVHDLSVADGNAINLGGASASGSLSVTAPGGITQSGNPVSAQGSATFDAGPSSDVTLGLANGFPGLRLTAQNATVTAGGPGVDLGPSQIAHNLTLAATGGAITQSGGPLAVPGTASFSSPAGVTVADPANDFGTLVLGGAQATVKDASGIVLGASTLTGGLNLVAKGPVTQSGLLNFGGSSSLDAGTANDITLPNVANGFALLAIPNARDALIDVTGNTNLGAVTTARDLKVEDASGNISAGQAISVARNATFDAAAGSDVTVPNGGNRFGGDVTVSGRNATINASGPLSLGGTTLAGTLAAAAASITQAGAITVGGTANLVSGPGAIALPNGANDFLGSVRLATAPGQNATVTDANDLTLGQSTVGGNLLATAAKRLGVPPSTEVNAVGTATLVSDAQAPAKPSIGDGGFVMSAGANLQSSGGPIAIYTAKRGQNSIDPTATFNGAKFKPGPLFINTNREVWGTYYPAGSAISPFTIFYKDNGKAAPQTKLKHPKKRWVTAKRHAKIKYAFTSPTPHVVFLCKLDRRPLRLCKSPFHASVKPGKHKFLVRAELGTVVDPTPAKVKFKVVRR